jgi:hypothetical protein
MVYNRAIISNFNDPDPEMVTEMVEYNLRLLVSLYFNNNLKFIINSMFMVQEK